MWNFGILPHIRDSIKYWVIREFFSDFKYTRYNTKSYTIITSIIIDDNQLDGVVLWQKHG